MAFPSNFDFSIWSSAYTVLSVQNRSLFTIAQVKGQRFRDLEMKEHGISGPR